MSLLDRDPWLALSGELSPSSEEPPVTHGEHKGQASHPAPWSDSSMEEGHPADGFPSKLVSFITQKSSVQKSFKPSEKNPVTDAKESGRVTSSDPDFLVTCHFLSSPTSSKFPEWPPEEEPPPTQADQVHPSPCTDKWSSPPR